MDTKNVDIARNLAYRMEEETVRKPLLMEEYDASFDDQAGIFPSGLGRPWAGGTDTLHSRIYYETYGRSFFKDQALEMAGVPCPDWHRLLGCRGAIMTRLPQSAVSI